MCEALDIPPTDFFRRVSDEMELLGSTEKCKSVK
jgi:hypothetical protein